DRRRVRVDEHDLVALLGEHLARLRPRVVELGGLPDDDRPRAEDQDPPQVVAPRHQPSPAGRVGACADPGIGACTDPRLGACTQPISAMNWSKRCSASCGPGPASGWYWTV